MLHLLGRGRANETRQLQQKAAVKEAVCRNLDCRAVRVEMGHVREDCVRDLVVAGAFGITLGLGWMRSAQKEGDILSGVISAVFFIGGLLSAKNSLSHLFDKDWLRKEAMKNLGFTEDAQCSIR